MNSAEKASKALSFLHKYSSKEYGKYLELTKQLSISGPLEHKQLELILVACAVMSQCEMCVALHTEAAAAQGATREEILQAALMAVAMGGSPKLMYMSYVYEALEDLFG